MDATDPTADPLAPRTVIELDISPSTATPNDQHHHRTGVRLRRFPAVPKGPNSPFGAPEVLVVETRHADLDGRWIVQERYEPHISPVARLLDGLDGRAEAKAKEAELAKALLARAEQAERERDDLQRLRGEMQELVDALHSQSEAAEASERGLRHDLQRALECGTSYPSELVAAARKLRSLAKGTADQIDDLRSRLARSEREVDRLMSAASRLGTPCEEVARGTAALIASVATSASSLIERELASSRHDRFARVGRIAKVAQDLTNMLRDIDEETLAEGRGRAEKLPADSGGE